MSRNENTDNDILSLFVRKDQVGNGYFDQFLFNSDTESDIDNMTHISIEEIDDQINTNNKVREMIVKENNDSDSDISSINTEIYEKIIKGDDLFTENDISSENINIYEKMMDEDDQFTDIDISSENMEIYEKMMEGGNNILIDSDYSSINMNDTDETATIEYPEYVKLVDIK